MKNWDAKQHLKTGIGLAFMWRYAKLFVNRNSIHGQQKIGRDGRVRYRNNLPGAIDLFRIRQALYGERTFAGYGYDTAGVNLRTTQKYIDTLTENIPYLKRENDEFFIDKNC